MSERPTSVTAATCKKCGSGAIHTRHHTAQGEHLHHTCRKCGFNWADNTRLAAALTTAHQLLRQARQALEDTHHVLTDWHLEHTEPAEDCLLCQINAALDEGKTTA